MSSKQQPRPITGAAVRAYRKLLAMNQADFAAAVTAALATPAVVAVDVALAEDEVEVEDF
jgi:hypothetical protein